MALSRSTPAGDASLPTEAICHGRQIVPQRTGLTTQEAAKRVADVYALAQTRMRAAQAAARDA